jgi:hypothetical protein
MSYNLNLRRLTGQSPEVGYAPPCILREGGHGRLF